MTGNSSRSDERFPSSIPGGGGNRPGAERGGRKPWTAPRLKTIRTAVGTAPLNPNSDADGVTCYQPEF